MSKVRKLFLMSFCIVVLSTMVFYPLLDTFAGKPSKPPKGAKSPITKVYKHNCRTLEDKFGPEDIVYIKVSQLPPYTDVNIYVLDNQPLTDGDFFTDARPGVVLPQSATTNRRGKIGCTTIWVHPDLPGYYDIGIDVAQDEVLNGKYDPGVDVILKVGVEEGFQVESSLSLAAAKGDDKGGKGEGGKGEGGKGEGGKGEGEKGEGRKGEDKG